MNDRLKKKSKWKSFRKNLKTNFLLIYNQNRILRKLAGKNASLKYNDSRRINFRKWQVPSKTNAESTFTNKVRTIGRSNWDLSITFSLRPLDQKSHPVLYLFPETKTSAAPKLRLCLKDLFLRWKLGIFGTLENSNDYFMSRPPSLLPLMKTDQGWRGFTAHWKKNSYL